MTVKAPKNIDLPVVTGLTKEIVDECFNEANDKLHDAVLTYEDEGLQASKTVKMRVGKLLAMARIANKEMSERLPANQTKSRNRLKELLLKIVNDEGAVSASLTSNTVENSSVVIAITGDGERSVEQLAKRVFHNAMTHGEYLSVIEFTIHDGSTRTVEINMTCVPVDYKEFTLIAYKGLTLKSAELGFISHTMYDIDKLASHYAIHCEKAKTESEALYLRRLCIALNTKAAIDTSVKYYSIDSQDDNCLVERLIGLVD